MAESELILVEGNVFFFFSTKELSNVLDVFCFVFVKDDYIINDLAEVVHAYEGLIHATVVKLTDRGYTIWGTQVFETTKGRDEGC